MSSALSYRINGKDSTKFRKMRNELQRIGMGSRQIEENIVRLIRVKKHHEEMLEKIENELKTLKKQKYEQYDKYLEAYDIFKESKLEAEAEASRIK